MKYASGAAFRTALEDRINRLAGQSNTARNRLRKMVVIDRLLARLFAVAPDRWIVKGGVALDLRLGDRARATKDLDLARNDTDEAAMEDLVAATEVELGDLFTFTVERADPLGVDDAAAVRYHVRAELGGKRFEEIALDIGFGDPLPSNPDLLTGPDILGFADLSPISIPALPLEQHVAQKFHAYTRKYGTGFASTRVKDLIDMVLIRSAAAFTAERLAGELTRTFQTRGTHDLPSAVPAPPNGWATAYRPLAIQTGLDPEVTIGHRLVATFLDPILSMAPNQDATWDPVGGKWVPPMS